MFCRSSLYTEFGIMIIVCSLCSDFVYNQIGAFDVTPSEFCLRCCVRIKVTVGLAACFSCTRKPNQRIMIGQVAMLNFSRAAINQKVYSTIKKMESSSQRFINLQSTITLGPVQDNSYFSLSLSLSLSVSIGRTNYNNNRNNNTNTNNQMPQRCSGH
jgi:hypothetical protein